MKKVIVIGAGFSGLSVASYLAKAGYDVSVLEKNDSLGGRARQHVAEGFTFDMGPSWYWMPDVFETFFSHFGAKSNDFYELKRLSPSYRVFWEDREYDDLPSDIEQLYTFFESKEEGSSVHLKKFLSEAAYKYEVGIQDLVYKPGLSWFEFLDKRILSSVFKLQMFQSLSSHVRKYFTHPKLIQILEFPVLFLGAPPQNIPALYSMMNYADMVLGTWYPQGGMIKVVDAMVSIAEREGVKFLLNEEVVGFEKTKGRLSKVKTKINVYEADIVIASADYHHIDQEILDKEDASYTAEYWDKKLLAPSALLYYVGLNKPITNLLHHNLFFDGDFDDHARDIYREPKWPQNPLFYVSVASKTDESTAPQGCENIVILVPTATNMKDDEAVRQRYFDEVITRMEQHTGQSIRPHIVYRKDYAGQDFIKDYHSYKGNAYGLANTLLQTSIFKPSIKSKKLNNLYYTGQLTVPGPGVPPALISGKVVADCVIREHKK